MNDAKGYQVSWLRRRREPVRLSWWRRVLGQERMRLIWWRHQCTVTLTDRQLEALGGWDAVSEALIVPLIHASTPLIAGLQVEVLALPTEYVRTNLLPHSGPAPADV